MNIFVLHPDSYLAAQYHCDQHLHKMILESAQMLSTAVRTHCSWRKKFDDLYKPTHLNHPCTQWLLQDKYNCLWLTNLASNLNSIRMYHGAECHASMKVIELASTLLEGEVHFSYASIMGNPNNFVFAGPKVIDILPLSIPEKYQKYYRAKHLQWLKEKGKGMTYKNRNVPEFMQDLIHD